MRQGAPNKKSRHKDRFPHERLMEAGHLIKLWKFAEREEARHEPEAPAYRPLDRELLQEVSCALGNRPREKEDVSGRVVSIRSPQLHSREKRGGISSPGHNCYWFIEERLPKRRDVLDRLEEAARKGDEPAFLRGLENIKWDGRPDIEFI